MWKKILLGIAVILCIAGGIYWFTYIKEIKTPVSSGINAIPMDAALIFESKQSITSWNKLATSQMWQEFIGSVTGKKLNVQIGYIDSLLKSSPSVAQLLVNQSVFISAHSSGINSFDFLFVYSLPNLSYQSTVSDFLKKVNSNHPPHIRTYDDTDIQTIHPPNKDSLSFALLQGTLMMSTNQTLVEDAIRQLQSGFSFSKDHNFSKVISTAGKNVDGNFYVNYKKFPELLNNFVSTALREETSGLSNFADYSGWDVTIKPIALLFSGFTQANDSSNSFLHLFAKQDPEEIELTRVIPSKTALLLFFGIGDIKTYHRNFKTYLNYNQRSQQYEQYITEIDKKYRVHVERSFLDWIKNEMALVITDPSPLSVSENSYAVLKAGNIKDADQLLNALADSISVKNAEKKDTAHYGDYIISHLNLPGILPTLFGWQFNKITNNYFTTVDDYVVFANSPNALKNFIHDFEKNKTLEKDNSYRTFTENISNEANIYVYASVPRLLGIAPTLLKEELSADAAARQDRIQKFDKFALQFSSNKNLFYSSACLGFNSMYGRELKPEWELKLDTSFHSPLYVINNYRSHAKDIFIQDDTNTAILVSNEGKISWKKLLPEPISGKVFQPVSGKNPKMQLLFNTSKALYKLDENGRDCKGFPVKFTSPATNSINMVSYEKEPDYRIFVAFKDKTVRCFNVLGAEVSGFRYIKTDNEVTLPVQYFRVNNKDYICAIDVEGKIYITDRQGEPRIRLKERFPQSASTVTLEAGADIEHTYLVTADSTGKIFRISLSNSKEQFRPQRFEIPVNMAYADIDNDGKKEYVFQSAQELTVYNQQKELTINYKFKETVLPMPLLVKLPDGTTRLGAISPGSELIYLLNSNGSPAVHFPAKGKTFFAIDDFVNEGLLYLITGTSGNQLVAYPLE
jgi:hypothetical protein